MPIPPDIPQNLDDKKNKRTAMSQWISDATSSIVMSLSSIEPSAETMALAEPSKT